MPRKKTNTQPEENRQRPDPMFKEVTANAARAAKINSKLDELRIQQVTSPDLLLTIPPDAVTKNTLFDFFRATNVLEFKSVSDRLTKGNFAQQMGRVYFYHEQSGIDFADLLNIVVTAYVPHEVLEYSAQRGNPFVEVPGRPWLRVGRVGWQDVAIVLCDYLPVEPRYAPWLLFASPRSQTWREFVLLMARARDTEMLDKAFNLSPKEFTKMTTEVKRIFDAYGPAEKARIRAEWREALPVWLKEFSGDLGDVLEAVSPEERVAGLKPEERVAGLKPEERQKLLEMLLAEQQELDKSDNNGKKQSHRRPKKES